MSILENLDFQISFLEAFGCSIMVYAELQIREVIEDNSKIFFSCFTTKTYVLASL